MAKTDWETGDEITAARLNDLGEAINEKAAQGDPGQDGTDGSDGQDGADGATPTIGDNGNWHINGEDTGAPARGADGSDADNPFSESEVTALKALVADDDGDE